MYFYYIVNFLSGQNPSLNWVPVATTIHNIIDRCLLLKNISIASIEKDIKLFEFDEKF